MKNTNIITIVLLNFLFISACGPEPPDTDTEYTLKNVSSHNIKIEIFDAYFDHIKNDTIFFITSNSDISYRFINNSHLPFGGPTDSVYIVFNDTKQIIYRWDDENPRNILDLNSYDGGKVSDYWYKYEYFITDDDYDNAVEIK